MKILFALVLATLLFCPQVSAETLTPSDFAYGCPLPGAENGSVYEFSLPLAVYEKVRRHDLGDLRIFNGAGQLVPHAVRHSNPALEKQETRQPIPFFPLVDPPVQQNGDLSLRVSRSSDGTVMTVDADMATTGKTASSWYLLDTSALKVVPTALELEWSSSGDGIIPVSLSQSSDLVHWSPLVSRAVLVDLNYSNSAIAVRRITLHGKTMPYLRLDSLDSRKPLQLGAVQAVSGTPPPLEQWQWLHLRANKKDEAGLVYEYALDSKIPVSGLQLTLPETNSLVRAMIEARTTDKDPWRTLHTGLFYDLTLDGQHLVSDPAPTSAGKYYRYWRVRVLHDGAGLQGTERAPRLDLGWNPDRILFIGRGQGPYTLAFGSTRIDDRTSHQDDLILGVMREVGNDSLIRRIEPGQMLLLGGDKALQPYQVPVNWKKILLWTVLVCGVALLAWMTRTIYRDMQGKGSQR